MKQPFCVTFLGDVDYKGYEISYLLLDRKIDHNFIYLENDYILRLHGLKELSGFDRIIKYLEGYEYFVDFWI